MKHDMSYLHTFIPTTTMSFSTYTAKKLQMIHTFDNVTGVGVISLPPPSKYASIAK